MTSEFGIALEGSDWIYFVDKVRPVGVAGSNSEDQAFVADIVDIDTIGSPLGAIPSMLRRSSLMSGDRAQFRFEFVPRHYPIALNRRTSVMNVQGVDCDLPPATLKKFATGKGNANKDAMVATAARLGCPADDDNEVDGWWLYQLGMYLHDKPQIPTTVYRDAAMVSLGWTGLKVAS